MKRLSKSVSVLQYHFGSEPNERDGMSVIAFSMPGMWRGVSGDVLASCRRSASARRSCIATDDCFEAIRVTHETVGWLSLKRATCAPSSSGQMASIASHSNSKPAISKSLFVNVPVGLVVETIAAVISAGHCIRNTVSGTGLFSPIMTPPTPAPDASVMPM